MPLFLYLEVGVINSISIFSPSFSLPISLTALLSFWTVCLRAPITRSPNPPPLPPPAASSVCVCRCETRGQIISALTSLLIPSLSARSPLLYLFSFSCPFIHISVPPSLPHRFKCAWSSRHWLFFTVLSPALSRDGISAVRPTQDTHSHPPVAPPPMFHVSTPYTFPCRTNAITIHSLLLSFPTRDRMYPDNTPGKLESHSPSDSAKEQCNDKEGGESNDRYIRLLPIGWSTLPGCIAAADWLLQCSVLSSCSYGDLPFLSAALLPFSITEALFRSWTLGECDRCIVYGRAVLSWLCRSRVVKWRCCLPCALSLSLSLTLSLFLSLSLSVSLFLPPPSFPSLPVSLNQDTACPFLCIAACLPSALLLYLSCTLSLALSAMRFQPLSVCRSPLYSPVTGLQHKQLRLQAFPLLFWTFITCVLSLVCVSNRTSFFNWVCCFCFCVSSQRQVSCRKGRKEVREDTSQCDERDAGRAGGMRKRFKWKKSRITIKCLIWMLRKPFSVSTSERSLPRWLERVRVACALGLGSGYISPWQSINPFACSSIPAPPARHFTF